MENPPPLRQKVTSESFQVNTSQNKSISFPHFMFPKEIHNEGNHIISLAELCSWMAERAEELEIDVISGFSCHDFIKNEKNEVVGVKTKEMGVDINGKKTENYVGPVSI